MLLFIQKDWIDLPCTIVPNILKLPEIMNITLLNRPCLLLKDESQFLQWLKMTNDCVGRRKWLESLLAGLLFFTLCGIWPSAAAAPVLAHIGKRTIIVGHTVVFDADATTDIGVRRTFSLVNAPAGTIINPGNGNF